MIQAACSSTQHFRYTHGVVRTVSGLYAIQGKMFTQAFEIQKRFKKIQPRAYLAWPECHSVDLDMQQSLKAELSVTRLNQYRCLNYTSLSVTVTKKSMLVRCIYIHI